MSVLALHMWRLGLQDRGTVQLVEQGEAVLHYSRTYNHVSGLKSFSKNAFKSLKATQNGLQCDKQLPDQD